MNTKKKMDLILYSSALAFHSILFYSIQGIVLLYNLPSSANLYISAMCGFFTGISAPNSISLAYVLIRYANDPITPTNTPMVNIQRGGTAVISSTNQNCHSSFNATANIAAAKPIIVTFRPVLILLLGPFIIGTRLLYSPIKPYPKGNTINTLYSNQFAGVNAESRIID